MRRIALLAAVVSLAAASQPLQPAARAPEGYASVVIDGVPHVQQRPDFCGEACVEMWLRRLGSDVTQDQVFGLSGVDPSLGRGVWTDELRRALEKLGFDVGPVWHRVDARSTEQAARGVEAQWAALHADLVRGVPSIVCMHYSDAPQTTEHFRLVLGYDAPADEVIFHEPAEARGAYRRMPRPLFLKLWAFHSRPDRITLIRLRLDRKEQADPPKEDGLPAAAFAQRVMELKEKTRGRPFTVVVEKPFVVIGDEAPEKVRERAASTVRWTVERLRKDFFARDPTEIVDVWVFKNEATYRKYAKELFDDTPDTPYGYYSAADHALVMNIGPGAGTLVHEIVHPYMRASHPTCPPWLNEGLASLFERPADKDGHLVGLVNWRLPTLKRAIQAKVLPSFKRLMAMNDAQFYEDALGTNYAQSRYLAYYLQERGLLVEFVTQAIANAAADPTGYATLEAVLGEDDLDAFQRRWEAFALKLE